MESTWDWDSTDIDLAGAKSKSSELDIFMENRSNGLIVIYYSEVQRQYGLNQLSGTNI